MDDKYAGRHPYAAIRVQEDMGYRPDSLEVLTKARTFSGGVSFGTIAPYIVIPPPEPIFEIASLTLPEICAREPREMSFAVMQ